jgi:DNA-binding transcriptional ArsR family regulator
MKHHLDQAIGELEQELESHVQSVSELEAALCALRRLAGSNGHAPLTRRTKKAKKALKRNERTNERAKRAPTRTARRSLPDDDGAAIIAQLKAHGPMTPGALAQALGISRPNLRYQIKPLESAGRVVSTGATANRRVSLPLRRPKEGL